MKVIGVIPSRFGSTRFPGKPLEKVAGKPLLQWVLERSAKAQLITELIVATDHESIAQLAESLGFEAVMTDSHLPSGSDRVWQAVKDRPCDLVLNIQGDEPLIEAQVLDDLINSFSGDSDLQMATLGREINDMETLRSLNTAKIVLNHKSEALYFSRFPLPYSRVQPEEGKAFYGCLKHIGVYAYRKNFLGQFCAHQPICLELMEGLEQLRALYLGARIKVVKTNLDSWGVDTPGDVFKVEKILKDSHESHE